MFEVEDLSQASPATVSRAGMIFLTLEDLGWWPYAESWIERRIAQGTHQVSMLSFFENKNTELHRVNCKSLILRDLSTKTLSELHVLEPDFEGWVETISKKSSEL